MSIKHKNKIEELFVAIDKTAEADNRAAILKMIAFVLAVLLCGVYVFNVFQIKDDKQGKQIWNSFYQEKENTLDGLYIGSSSVYMFWMPTKAYSKYGYCIPSLATSAQSIATEKYIMEEALRTQPGIKVFFVDIRNISRPAEGMTEGDVRQVTDCIKTREIREKAIDSALTYYKKMGADIDYDKNDYINSFLFYHNRWAADLGPRDFKVWGVNNKYKGFVINGRGYEKIHLEKPADVKGTTKLAKVQIDTLNDLLDYCDSIKQKVIFVSSPYATDSVEKRQILNTAHKMIRKRGYEVWDFNHEPLLSKVNMNWHKDYFEKTHTNVYGAQKFTRFMARRIHKRLDLPDHRGSADYVSWDKAASDLNQELKIKGDGQGKPVSERYIINPMEYAVIYSLDSAGINYHSIVDKAKAKEAKEAKEKEEKEEY
ncbi:MAG: hypothetical protein ACOX4I_05790 [Anaerovoracaceae bacterium]|jgi:hypothetical protein